MVDVSYTPNQAGWREIAHSPELLRACMQVGEAAKEFAEGISPRHSGEYASSFHLEPTRATLGGRERVAVELQNTSGHAAAVEWGKEGRSDDPGSSAHHVLKRTLDFLEHR